MIHSHNIRFSKKWMRMRTHSYASQLDIQWGLLCLLSNVMLVFAVIRMQKIMIYDDKWMTYLVGEHFY